MLYFQLFWTYLKIGTFTIGGGYVMLSMIEHEVVERKGWIDREEFLNMIALAQAAPGLIAVNSAIFIGGCCIAFVLDHLGDSAGVSGL